MKPFTFLGATGVAAESAPAGVPAFGFDGVYPNPTADRITVAFYAEGPARLEVIDLLGRRVATLHDGPVAEGQRVALDAAALSAGVYVLRLSPRPARVPNGSSWRARRRLPCEQTPTGGRGSFGPRRAGF